MPLTSPAQGVTYSPVVSPVVLEMGAPQSPPPPPPPPPPEYPFLPDVDVPWYAAGDYANGRAPNLSEPALIPSASLIGHTAGYMPNTTGQNTTPPITMYQAGPDGVSLDAQRFNFGAAQVHYVHRSSTETDLPAGTYTLAFEYIRNTGSDQSFQAGLSTTLTNLTATSAWQQAAIEITYAGTGDIVIRTAAATTADVLIARRRLSPGAPGVLPAWADEHFVGGRRPYAFTNSLTLDSEGVVVADGAPGLIVYDDDYKIGGKAHTSLFLVGIFNATGHDTAQSNMILAADEDDGHGNDDGAVQMFLEATPGYLGVVTWEPFTESIRGIAGVDARNQGVVAVGLWLDTSGLKTAFLGPIPVRTTQEAWGGITSSLWRAMANNDDDKPEKIAFNLPGTAIRTIVHEMPVGATLSDAALLIDAALYNVGEDLGVATGWLFNALIFGDSNDSGTQPSGAAPAGGEWPNLTRGRDYLGGGRKAIPVSNMSVGGAGFLTGSVTFEEQWVTGPDATDTDPQCGGEQIIDIAVERDHPIVVYMRGNTNDRTQISSDPDGLFNDYFVPFYDRILAKGDLVFLHIASPLAIIDDSGWANFNTPGAGRFRFAELQQAYADAHPGRVWFTDVTNDPILGSTAEANKFADTGVSSIYFEDLGVHLIEAGEAYLADLQKPTWIEIYDYIEALVA